jgi:hypothetical protein
VAPLIAEAPEPPGLRRVEAGPGREIEGASRGPRPYLETAADFLAGEDVPLPYLVNELVPEKTISLWHGEPRTRKTWAGGEIALAIATGTPAFGLKRFSVPEPGGVLWSLQEDAKQPTRIRLRRLLRGRGLAEPPRNLFLSVHGGIDLEDPAWQETLLRDIRERGIRLAIFDPMRRYSRSADKGPSDVSPVTGFLRRIAVETDAAVLGIHHDTKPLAGKDDGRRRGHRASGGDWFAAADCPVALEPAGDRTLVVPEDFKFSEAPASFLFSIEEDHEKTWARLAAEDSNASDTRAAALQARIVDWLQEHPGASSTQVAKGVRANREAVFEALKSLDENGTLDSTQGKRNSLLWFVRRTSSGTGEISE